MANNKFPHNVKWNLNIILYYRQNQFQHSHHSKSIVIRTISRYHVTLGKVKSNAVSIYFHGRSKIRGTMVPVTDGLATYGYCNNIGYWKKVLECRPIPSMWWECWFTSVSLECRLKQNCYECKYMVGMLVWYEGYIAFYWHRQSPRARHLWSSTDW